MIPGLPEADSRRLLGLIQTHPSVKQVVLYGSRALGRQRPGSDIDLCLEAPAMTLGELLELGGALDDLLLPDNDLAELSEDLAMRFAKFFYSFRIIHFPWWGLVIFSHDALRVV